MVGGTGGAREEREQHERGREGDDRDVDVAELAVEHEVAEKGGRGRRDHCRDSDRGDRLAGVRDEVDCGHAVRVPAEPEEARLSEAEDACLPPNERQAQGEQSEQRPVRVLDRPEFRHSRRDEHGHACRHPEQ